MCNCQKDKIGVDLIYKNLPPPPADLTQKERLRRFCDIVSKSPSMNVFDARLWLRDSEDLLDAINRKRTALQEMMEDFITKFRIYPEEIGLSQTACLLGGKFIKDKPASIQIEEIAKECRAAVASFISCDWATVTKVGIFFIRRAYEVSDPQRFPYHDRDLRTIYSKGVECLECILNSGYSNNELSWRLAMEPDRQPQGTAKPVKSATQRDYFLRQYNSTHCQNCGKDCGTSLMLCSGCKSVGYCSRECQKSHWKFHKPTCKETQKEIKAKGSGGLDLD